MKNDIKKAFDDIIPSDFKKKYFYKNGEEEILFYKGNTKIELIKVLLENRNYLIEVIIEKENVRTNIFSSHFFDKEELVNLQKNLSALSTENQIVSLREFIQRNKKSFFE